MPFQLKVTLFRSECAGFPVEILNPVTADFCYVTACKAKGARKPSCCRYCMVPCSGGVMDRDVVQMLADRSVVSSADLKIKDLTALKYVIDYSGIVTHRATDLPVTVKPLQGRGPNS